MATEATLSSAWDQHLASEFAAKSADQVYTVCTQNLIREFRLPFLEPIPAAFVWVALAAWGLTFAGLIGHVATSMREGTIQVPPVVVATEDPRSDQGGRQGAGTDGFRA